MKILVFVGFDPLFMQINLHFELKSGNKWTKVDKVTGICGNSRDFGGFSFIEVHEKSHFFTQRAIKNSCMQTFVLET